MSSETRTRVLIVEDNRIILDFLRDSLRMKGYDAFTASNGAEAIDLLGGQSVDIVLSDVMMPKMDGVTMAKRLKMSHPELPIVLITGVHSLDIDRILDESGAVACLAKPLHFLKLCEALEEALAGVN